MDHITVICEVCGAQFTVPASMAGRKGRCSCGNLILVGRPASQGQQHDATEPADSFEDMWYWSEGGKAMGPVTLEELRRKATDATLSPDQMVFNSKLGAWTRAAEVAELAAYFGPLKESETGWHVSIRGKNYGPYEEGQIHRFLAEGRIGADTLLWTEALGGWRRLAEVEPFATLLAQQKAAEGEAQAAIAEAEADVEELWYYVRGGRREGPLSLDQIVDAARTGRLSAGDRVWSNRLNRWCDADQVEELAAALRQASPEQMGVLWYWRRGKEQKGPLSFPELRGLVENGTVRPGDEVYSKTLMVWRDIRQVPELEDAIIAAETGLARAEQGAAAWYFMKAGTERGPISERLLGEMVSSGRLGAEDLVWGPGLEDWQPLATVPQFARRLGAAAQPAGAAAFLRAAGTRARRSVLKRFWPAALALAALVAAIYGGGRLQKKLSEEPPTPPPAPKGPQEVVAEWLGMFLRQERRMTRPEREALREKLKAFYPGGYLDLYSEDMRRSLQRAHDAAPAQELRVREVECAAKRAEDSEHFCYHLPFSGKATTVEAAVPSAASRVEYAPAEKTFSAPDFQRLRRFQVAAGEAQTAVLAVGEGAQLKIVAFGRAAQIGASASGRRVQYLVGYKSSSGRESETLVRVGTADAPGAKESWEAFGQLMSLDCALVPASVRQEKERLLQEDVQAEWALVFGRSRMPLDELERLYGPPHSREDIGLDDPRFYIDPNIEQPLYSVMRVHYYGSFAVITETDSNTIVAFAYKK